ncbi:TauD/TfdA family dioxygenase [soil metagenome]
MQFAGGKIEKLTPFLGAVVTGVDLRQALGDMTRDAFLRVVSEHGMLVFRGQQLQPDDFAAISHFCGELEHHVLDQYRMDAHPEIYVISNIVEDGVPLGNPRDGFGWHTDQSYLARPTAYTLLYGAQTPEEGADTLFADTCGAYERLEPQLRKAIAQLRGVHSYMYMRTGNATYIRDNAVSAAPSGAQVERVPDVIHPLVRTNPSTGRRSLYLGGDCLAAIEGMEPASARALIDTLFEAALEPEFQLRHQWRQGDLVIWDNRGTMHTATEYDREKFRRLIWRTSVRGEAPQ